MTELNTLAADWLQAKADEAAARKRRVDIESKMLPHLKAKDEGSTTTKTDQFKVVLTNKTNRKLDAVKWEEIKSGIPADYQPVTYQPKLEETRLKWLKENAPDIYAHAAQAITATPAKAGIKCEALEQK